MDRSPTTARWLGRASVLFAGVGVFCAGRWLAQPEVPPWAPVSSSGVTYEAAAFVALGLSVVVGSAAMLRRRWIGAVSVLVSLCAAYWMMFS